MSLTTDILAEVRRNPGATAEEIADAVGDTVIRVRQNLTVMGSPSGGRLVSKELDEVTRKPGYKITEAGQKKLNGHKDVAPVAKTEAAAPEPEAESAPAPADGATEDPQEEPLAARLERYEAAIAEIHDVCRDAGIQPGMVHERVKALAEKISERSQAEMSLLNVIGNIRTAIGDPTGKIMLGELADRTRAIYDLGEAHKRACMQWEQSMMAAIGEDGVGDVAKAIAHLKEEAAYNKAGFNSAMEERNALRAELAAERQAREALQEQINADPAVDVKDAARGYLVRAPKRRLRILTKPESAVAAAMAAARNGSGRGDVFALVPVGTARRGAEWRDA
jgi:hypothetical protein